MGIEKNTGMEHGLYPEQVNSLRLSNVDEFDENTVAYARLGEETLITLAATGEAPYASLVPDALEYKLAEFDDELDDPLRDLSSPTGTTKFFFMVGELAKRGFNVHQVLDLGEESDLIRFLDDFKNDRFPEEAKSSEAINKFVTKAREFGISRPELNKIFNKASKKKGVLIGLSQAFLDEAGDDAWPEQNNIKNNHPCRYAKLRGGLKLEHITGILPLDKTSNAVMDTITNNLDDKVEKVKTLVGQEVDNTLQV
ncbi:hypothetical protein J7J83_00350 [bacterium]|nr:hypothetical protein [bacterium]